LQPELEESFGALRRKIVELGDETEAATPSAGSAN
jgi:hypothetical protein